MYSQLIQNLSYMMHFDFAQSFNFLKNYSSLIAPGFLAILGVRIGISFLRDCFT